MVDLRTVYGDWLEERRLARMEPLSSDAHIHIMALIERYEKAVKDESNRPQTPTGTAE